MLYAMQLPNHSLELAGACEWLLRLRLYPSTLATRLVPPAAQGVVTFFAPGWHGV